MLINVKLLFLLFKNKVPFGKNIIWIAFGSIVLHDNDNFSEKIKSFVKLTLKLNSGWDIGLFEKNNKVQMFRLKL